MNFLVCADSFKDAISGSTANVIIAEAIMKELPDAQVDIINISDGGPGFIDSMIQNKKEHRIITLNITGPLKDKINSRYAIIDNIAIIEMAKASGLELIPQNKRNPNFTTTHGVGELILDALDKNVRKIIIGLGGSATNDAGAGVLQALGAKLLDQNYKKLELGGINLSKIFKINLDGLDSRLKDVEIVIASDVNSPLLGSNGATYIYAKQKGAVDSDLEHLEKALTNYANITQNIFNINYTNHPGSGAAGGLAYTLLLLGGKLKSGIELVMLYNNFEEKLINTNYVFSGEGSIDEQTIYGKTISGIAKLCKKHNKPLIVLTGKSLYQLDNIYKMGVTAVFPIGNAEIGLEKALQNAKQNLRRTIQNIIKVLPSTKT